MIRNCLLLIIALFNASLFAQTPRNLLPRHINVPETHHISPSLSGDGRHMVFVSNFSSTEKMILKYTYLDENNRWTEPVELDNISQANLDFVGGHWLSYDGTLLFFTSKRGPGIGKFDILFSERKGSYFTPPQNIGKPVNSPGNEGHPSLSPDGRYLYFMRCEEMDNYKANRCELYVAERRTDSYWHEPQKLPYPINTGNESTPRIMPDGETLLFASKRTGGKDGFDIYLSRFANGKWSVPEACDYLNTPEDDQYVSIPAHGDLAYYSGLFRSYYAIIRAEIPENLKPKKVALIQGTVLEEGTNKPLDAVIQVYHAKTGELDQFIKSKPDGSFFVMAKGDDIYDFSVSARGNKHLFYSTLYDLRNLQESKIENLSLRLSLIKNRTIFTAEDICFEPNSAQLKDISKVALLRLAKLLKDNPGTKIEISVHTDEVRRDSIPSDPDLTEVMVDTVFLPEYDSLGSITMDDSIPSQQYNTLPENFSGTTLFDQDSCAVFDKPRYFLKYTWHNDRTHKQAQAIAEKLMALGVPSTYISAIGHSDEENLAPNNTEENRNKNRRIEILFWK